MRKSPGNNNVGSGHLRCGTASVAFLDALVSVGESQTHEVVVDHRDQIY